MASEDECRRAANALVGEHIAGVLYVGLSYDGAAGDDVRWDFGDWHWPEVGVELSTREGNRFHVIWDQQLTHFELTVASGPISDTWLPLREQPPRGRSWEVSDHPRWAPLVGEAVTDYDISLFAADDPPVVAPVALRLVIALQAVWIAAAAPRDYFAATEILATDDVYLGHDEVLVAFGDRAADRLGLRGDR